MPKKTTKKSDDPGIPVAEPKGPVEGAEHRLENAEARIAALETRLDKIVAAISTCRSVKGI